MQTAPKVLCLERAIPAAHQSVFACLLRVNEESGLNTILRVAGGWVRDILLDRHSNDIDIAIESPITAPVSGEQFAHAIAAFQAAQGDRARTVSVIRANPALSKHIETATVCVHDIPVEFCALRTDSYTSDSRIPQVRSATPLEDALRRDFTINALFYNLHTGCVEDYTTGLEDLQARRIRCPLDPQETFTDDPLRLLRGVRFVGQLGDLDFVLDPSIAACVDDKLLAVLQHKVSRERIGKEFTKMMSGAQPQKCVDILLSTGLLHSTVLVEVYMKTIPGRKQASAEIDHVARLVDAAGDAATSSAQMALLAQLNARVTPLFSGTDAAVSLDGEPEWKLAAVLFELVLPFLRGLSSVELEPRLYAVCVNGLKLPLATHHAVRRMLDCYNILLREQLSASELCSPGLLLDSVKMKLFAALEVMNDPHVFADAFKVVLLTYLAVDGGLLSQHKQNLHPALAKEIFVVAWGNVEQHPEVLGAYALQLPLKGNELHTIAKVPAKEIGPTLLEIRRRMVLNPSLTRDDVVAWLTEQRGCSQEQ